MKFNNKQSFAILSLLVSEKYLRAEDIFRHHNDFGELFDGECKELRVIHKYGAAGKLWNNHDRIYISGHSENEINKEKYFLEQQEIKEINELVVQLIGLNK